MSDKHFSHEKVCFLAAEVGKEFESLINKHGFDTISDLMSKVVSILEYLDYLNSEKDAERQQVEDLLAKISFLEKEKARSDGKQESMQNDLEQIEEEWRQEHSRDFFLDFWISCNYRIR